MVFPSPVSSSGVRGCCGCWLVYRIKPHSFDIPLALIPKDPVFQRRVLPWGERLTLCQSTSGRYCTVHPAWWNSKGFVPKQDIYLPVENSDSYSCKCISQRARSYFLTFIHLGNVSCGCTLFFSTTVLHIQCSPSWELPGTTRTVRCLLFK